MVDSPLTTEFETANFLREFVRYAKPKVVVETGCHLGCTSTEIGLALRMNEAGKLHTCDTDPRNAEITASAVKCCELPVTVQNCSGRQLIQELPEKVDMAYLDSGDKLERVEEAKLLMSKLSPQAWVFLHDALQTEDPCYRYISAATNWPSIVFPFGRGLAMFYVGNELVKNRLV